MRAAATGGVLIGLGMYAAQLGLPSFLKPSVIAGQIAGDTERSDIEAKQATVIAYERGKADAVAQANAKAQADLAVMQKTLDTTTASVEPLAQLAGAADVFCLLGQAVAALSAPTGQVRGDWRGISTDNSGADINHAAQAVAGVSCGISAPIRDSVRSAQLDAVREVTAARGMPMTNGAVQFAAAPARPVAAPAVVNLALAPHRAWSRDMQNELHVYASRLPEQVLKVFVDDLDMSHGWPDVWFDRVAYYRDAQRG